MAVSIKVFYHFFLLFSLIFNFRIPIFYNSVILAFFLCLPVIFFKKSARNNIINILSSIHYLKILLLTLLLIIIFFIYPFIREIYDYSYSIKFISQLVIIISTISVISVISNKNNKDYIPNLIFFSFFFKPAYK
jgi:hypothetical protein